MTYNNQLVPQARSVSALRHAFIGLGVVVSLFSAYGTLYAFSGMHSSVLAEQEEDNQEVLASSVKLDLPLIRVGPDLVRKEAPSGYSLRLHSEIDLARVEQLKALGVTRAGIFVFCDPAEWEEGYQEGQELVCYGSDLRSTISTKWLLPEDRDGWNCRQLISSIVEMDLSPTDAFDADPDGKSRFEALWSLSETYLAEESTAFVFQPASVLAYPRGGVFLHCAQLYDNRHWVLGVDGSVARLAVPSAFPETSLVTTIGELDEPESIPNLWGYNRKGFWTTNGNEAERDFEFVEQWMRNYDLRRGDRDNDYLLLFANRHGSGNGLLALYSVSRKTPVEKGAMHPPQSDRELAIVCIQEGERAGRLHHFRVGSGSYGGLGDFVASRGSIMESPNSHLALFGKQLLVWISGSVWFIDLETGKINPAPLSFGDLGLTTVLGQLETGELVTSASWGLDTIRIIDFTQ